MVWRSVAGANVKPTTNDAAPSLAVTVLRFATRASSTVDHLSAPMNCVWCRVPGSSRLVVAIENPPWLMSRTWNDRSVLRRLPASLPATAKRECLRLSRETPEIKAPSYLGFHNGQQLFGAVFDPNPRPTSYRFIHWPVDRSKFRSKGFGSPRVGDVTL